MKREHHFQLVQSTGRRADIFVWDESGNKREIAIILDEDGRGFRVLRHYFEFPKNDASRHCEEFGHPFED